MFDGCKKAVCAGSCLIFGLYCTIFFCFCFFVILYNTFTLLHIKYTYIWCYLLFNKGAPLPGYGINRADEFFTDALEEMLLIICKCYCVNQWKKNQLVGGGVSGGVHDCFRISLYINGFPSNFVLPGWNAKSIISSGTRKHKKSKLHGFSLFYINVIISYSFKLSLMWTGQSCV